MQRRLGHRRSAARIDIPQWTKRAVAIGLGLLLFGATGATKSLPSSAETSYDLTLALHFGRFAVTNPHGLWITTTAGSLRQVTANPSAANPQWSSNGQYLAYETSGSFGSNPQLHVEQLSDMRTLLTTSAFTFAWRPGHAWIAALSSQGLRLIAVSSGRAKTLRVLGGGNFDELPVIWSSNGNRLAYAVTRGQVGHDRHDVVQEVSLENQSISNPQTAFSSVTNTGIRLAAFFPDSYNILYWPDPEYSASLMADGAVLYQWQAKTHRRIRYSLMLPYSDYLTLGGAGRWAYMAGGPRPISGDKSVVLIDRGIRQSLTPPPGLEAVEPNINAAGDVTAVLAANDLNASWGLGTSYQHWLKTRRLAVWQGGSWQVWKSAGTGVTDPVWAPGGEGIFYLANNQLWLVRGPSATPIALVGPVASSGGYYGEILRSSRWSLWPNLQ